MSKTKWMNHADYEQKEWLKDAWKHGLLGEPTVDDLCKTLPALIEMRQEIQELKRVLTLAGYGHECNRGWVKKKMTVAR